MSDEEDYMSDAFLANLDDKRPGLLSKADTKKVQSVKKHESTNVKSRKVLENEKRSEGLSKELDSKNKGYSMLQKMGFKPGMTLGKKGEGRSEPVPIEIKVGRSGLGRDTQNEMKRKARDMFHKMSSEKRKKHLEETTADFLSSQRSNFNDKAIKRDLNKSQKVCVQLDNVKGLEKPVKAFFWPDRFSNEEEDEEKEEVEEIEDDIDDEEDFNEEEKLQHLTEYLRTSYFYCLWCGIKYEDENDLVSNCPGDKEDLHD